LVKTKQILGILGILMAVIGGVAWFFQQKLPALVMREKKTMIKFHLNKKKKNKIKQQ